MLPYGSHLRGRLLSYRQIKELHFLCASELTCKLKRKLERNLYQGSLEDQTRCSKYVFKGNLYDISEQSNSGCLIQERLRTRQLPSLQDGILQQSFRPVLKTCKISRELLAFSPYSLIGGGVGGSSRVKANRQKQTSLLLCPFIWTATRRCLPHLGCV